MSCEIKKITDKEAGEIIDTRQPEGLFFLENSNGTFTAIDNTNGDAWTENFVDLESAKYWLENEDVEYYTEIHFGQKLCAEI